MKRNLLQNRSVLMQVMFKVYWTKAGPNHIMWTWYIIGRFQFLSFVLWKHATEWICIVLPFLPLLHITLLVVVTFRSCSLKTHIFWLLRHLGFYSMFSLAWILVFSNSTLLHVSACDAYPDTACTWSVHGHAQSKEGREQKQTLSQCYESIFVKKSAKTFTHILSIHVVNFKNQEQLSSIFELR